MASSTNKLSQQELRQLMRDNAKSKATKHINSALAKYDEEDNLWCIVCNIIVHETVWTTHLIEKTHKKVFFYFCFY